MHNKTHCWVHSTVQSQLFHPRSRLQAHLPFMNEFHRMYLDVSFDRYMPDIRILRGTDCHFEVNVLVSTSREIFKYLAAFYIWYKEVGSEGHISNSVNGTWKSKKSKCWRAWFGVRWEKSHPLEPRRSDFLDMGHTRKLNVSLTQATAIHLTAEYHLLHQAVSSCIQRHAPSQDVDHGTSVFIFCSSPLKI